MRHRRLLRHAWVALVAALAGACVSVEEPVPEPVRFGDLHVPEGARDLACTVFPHPERAQYGERMFDLVSALRFGPEHSTFREVLRRRDLETVWDELEAGYVIVVDQMAGRPIVAAGSRDRAGAVALRRALAQLWFVHDGRVAVRECSIVSSGGAFPLRGSKRLRRWELAYGATLSWGESELWYAIRNRPGDFGTEAFADAEPLDAYVEMIPYAAPGSPLDATDAGVQRVLDGFAKARESGARRFAVKFDDVGFELTPASRLAFGGYARAVRSFLTRVRDGLRADVPDAVVYYLPQTYWWTDPRMEPFAGALRAAGGLPPDLGLVMTGPDVTSATIDAAGLSAARETFGLTQTPALIYDNLGREGDWGPLIGRDAALAGICDGVFGERGTPVNRLTRLDWSYDPADYDAEWSWRRAVYELAGPAAYGELLSVCRLFREKAPESALVAAIDRFEVAATGAPGLPIAPQELVELLRADARLPVGVPAVPAD